MDVIDILKMGNVYFVKLFVSYLCLIGMVEDLEEYDMLVVDFMLEDMKKQCVKLKDEFYYMLLVFWVGQ